MLDMRALRRRRDVYNVSCACTVPLLLPLQRISGRHASLVTAASMVWSTERGTDSEKGDEEEEEN